MKLNVAVICLIFALMPLFALSGCLMGGNTDDIVSAKYYGRNSFRLGYAGMWEDDSNFKRISVRNNTGATYIIIETKRPEWATSYAINYKILYVYPDWMPGERIIVSYSGTGKTCVFDVPEKKPQ
jgi:hypothetical protein